jgi:hypothetical protein
MSQESTALCVTAMAILGLMATSADAAVITGVTIEGVSSEVINLVPRDAVFAIDGSGFDEVNGFHSTSANGTMWTSAGNIGGEPGSPDLLSGGVDITFDLEGNYDLSSLKVWNFNEPSALTAGAKDATISVAASEGGPFTLLGSFVFNKAPGSAATDFGQVIDLSSFAAADNTRLVRFDITTNYGWTNNGGLVGLSEVRFIPEPASLVILALGGLAVLRRRRD